MNMHRSAARRNGRRATSATRPRPNTDTRRRTITREVPGRGRVAITGPGAVEFLRALDTGDA